MIYRGYHGTYKKFPSKNIKYYKHGGIHVGTYKAAIDRLVNKFTKLEQAFIYPVTVHCKKVYGSIENPIYEDELDVIIENSLHIFKKRGYSCIIYKNIAEDPGSISVLVLHRAIIDVDKPEIINIKDYI